MAVESIAVFVAVGLAADAVVTAAAAAEIA